ncbi:hypothetical protein M7I_5665 [Glarea lozoyensis 74030]|nr:hypothetical protein M7I_5665 [Glarea lozoyensis 74030]
MKFSQVIFGVAAAASAVSAIDIWMYLEDKACENHYVAMVCTGVNPGACCYYDGAGANSVGFRAIPKGWRLDLTGYSTKECKGLLHSVGMVGPTDWCFKDDTGKNKNYRSGNYYFSSSPKKRSEAESSCVRADTMVLPDGTKLDVSSLDEVAALEL